ncbi:MAG: glycoside hydrolase family 3 protein [Candidatus Coproplasma sp.]
MVNLTAKPFNLDGEGVAWVENTLSAMSVEEKLQQLFIEMPKSSDGEYLAEAVKVQKFGGVRYNNAPPRVVRRQNEILQKNSKIPLIIACNAEAGGNGACMGGTDVGLPVKIASTGDEKYAYELGRISGTEARAVGCNCTFAPIADVNMNWRNPIISVRSFGSDPDLVLKYCMEYMRGFNESGGICVMKHFPGDGVDERDQHLSSSVNSLSVEDWNATFGKVYRGMIEAGVQGIMAGHIMFPAWQTSHGDRLLPATLSRSVIGDLLRGELGFNGLIITDASHMVGLTSAMKRRDILPAAIAAGCDMFLFTNDYEEDLGFMRDGYESGVITAERLDDAVRRILATKARIGLHRADRDALVPDESGLSVIGCEEFSRISAEVSDRAITLIKEEQGVLPLDPVRHRRILLVPQLSENPFAAFMPKRATPVEQLAALLEKEGFAVTIYESVMEQAKKLPPAEATAKIMNIYGNKTPISSITDNYDVIIQVAHVLDHNTVQRISWSVSKGTPDVPWYVHELPTVFVSLFCPFHLADVPQVKTYINCYDKNANTLSALVDKLVGRSQFTGKSPVDAFCGMIDAKL